jgi:hypothetical protein
MTEHTYVKVGVSLRDRIKELNDTELRVLVALGLRINKERECWPAVGVLMEECNRSKRMVQYAVTRLIEKGFINVGRRVGGRGKVNVYTLNGYFAYGSETVQLMTPFSEETLQLVAPFSGKKGAISNKKGAISNTKRVQSAQASQTRKKNHISRTKEVEPITSSGPRKKRGNTDPTVNEIFAEMRKYLGYHERTPQDPIPSYGKEAQAIKRMLTRGFTSEDILACWKGKVSQRGGEFVSMVWANEDIGRRKDSYGKDRGFREPGQHSAKAGRKHLEPIESGPEEELSEGDEKSKESIIRDFSKKKSASASENSPGVKPYQKQSAMFLDWVSEKEKITLGSRDGLINLVCRAARATAASLDDLKQWYLWAGEHDSSCRAREPPLIIGQIPNKLPFYLKHKREGTLDQLRRQNEPAAKRGQRTAADKRHHQPAQLFGVEVIESGADAGVDQET